MSVIEAEVMPSGERPDFEGVKVRVAHVRSLGVVGAFLALMTMLAAVGFGLIMLFGQALLAAALVKYLWPVVFSPEFTRWMFGSEAVPFYKIFLLMVLGSMVVKILDRKSTRLNSSH